MCRKLPSEARASTSLAPRSAAAVSMDRSSEMEQTLTGRSSRALTERKRARRLWPCFEQTASLVPREHDLEQIDAVAREFGMSRKQRFEFGDFLEDEKAAGNGGTKNLRGDFTVAELRVMAREFLEEA